MLEKDIERQILDYLSLRSGVFAWKNDSVGIFDPKKKVFRRKASRHKINGVSDILGVLDGGRFLAIEVKAGKNRTTPSQKAFLKKVTDMGGLAMVVYSLDEVIKGLDSQA